MEYIGVSKNPDKRLKGHRYAKTYMGNAIRKYGLQNFELIILDELASYKEAYELEPLYIEEANCLWPNGYNLDSGGMGGKKHPKETIEKMRFAQKEVWDLEKRSEHGIIMRDILGHPDVRKKKAAAAKEAMNRPETKERSRTSAKKRWNNPEEKQRQSERMIKVMNQPGVKQKLITSHLDSKVKSKTAVALTRNKTRPEMGLFQLIEEIVPGQFIHYGLRGFQVGQRWPDFVDQENHFLIELFGNHWHGEEFTGLSKEEHERERINYFHDFGWRTLIIWEHDFQSNPKEVKKRILSFIQRL